MTGSTDITDLGRDDRAVCIALAGWLRAQSVLAQLAVLLAFIAVLALMSGRASSPAVLLAGSVLVLVLPERYLALRLAFDVALFEAWGRGAVDAGSVDHALVRLRLKQQTLQSRPFDDRIAGALRLQRVHLGVVMVQTVLTVVALWTTVR